MKIEEFNLKNEQTAKINIDMFEFRKKITELIQEAKTKKIFGGSELKEIDPNDLTEEDACIWNEYNSNLITREEIIYGSEYHHDVEKDKNNAKKYNSRENFLAFIRQRLTK